MVAQIVQPSDDQRRALEQAKTVVNGAAQTPDATYPKEIPAPLDDRLNTLSHALATLANSLATLRPAFVTRYASRSDEQRARLLTKDISRNVEQIPAQVVRRVRVVDNKKDAQPGSICHQWIAALRSWPTSRTTVQHNRRPRDFLLLDYNGFAFAPIARADLHRVLLGNRRPAACLRRARLESYSHSGDPIVADHGILGHRDLVAGSEDQIDRPRWAVFADLEAPEDDAGRQHHLVHPLMYSIRPVDVINLEFRPQDIHQMILEGRVPQERIAKISHILNRGFASRVQASHRELHAKRRLDVEIAPSLTHGQSRLRGPNVGRYRARRAERVRHLEEGGNDIIAVLCVRGDEPILEEKSRPITPARRTALRAGSRLVRRSGDDRLKIVSGYELNPGAAGAAIVVDPLTVSVRARSVLLEISIPPELLFEARGDGHKRGHPAWLRSLRGRNHVKPGSERVV